MASEADKTVESVGGIPVRSEPVGYSADEMSACGKCGRANAPLRAECLYCGTALSVDMNAAAAGQITLREPEAWERGTNVVLLGLDGATVHLEALTAAGVEKETAEKLSGFASPTPLIRVATEEAAAVIAERLGAAGIRAAIFSDEELTGTSGPVRLRSIEHEDGKLVLYTFNSNDAVTFSAEDLRLIVTGSLIETRSETQMKRKKGAYKGVEDSIVRSDTGVADLYFAEDLTGYRILTAGFDFSHLGDAMGIIAAENLKAVVSVLRMLSPNAVLADDFAAKRSMLERVWQCGSRNESKGVQRTGFGLTVTKGRVSDNSEQFTKYSRLMRFTL